jgi:hypothetical protein
MEKQMQLQADEAVKAMQQQIQERQEQSEKE